MRNDGQRCETMSTRIRWSSGLSNCSAGHGTGRFRPYKEEVPGSNLERPPERCRLSSFLRLVASLADEPPGFHLALAFHVDDPHWLCGEVVAQQLPGGAGDLDLVRYPV